MPEKWTSGLRLPRRIVRISLLLLLCLPLMGQVNAASEYVVINTLDSGDGSLRWAIEQANSHPGLDVIRFHPSLTDKTILLASSLPPLTDNGTTIDASPNWVGSWPTGEPGIGLTNGSGSTATVGLHIKGADNCLVKGLRITGLPVGIFVSTGDDPGNRATGNTIGAGSPGGRMLIRNCGFDAIRIDNSDSNRILGCYIGTSKAGNLPEPNGGAGVYIYNGRFNEIGGTGPLEGNLIGASQHGVWIEGNDAVSNIVQANEIGVGMLDGDIGNRGHGVFISLGASQNQVGGTSPDSGNSILNNDYSGVFIGQEGGSILVNGNSSTPDEDRANLTAFSIQNSLTGNYIADNSLAGIEIQLADNNTIQGNTIVRNGQSGVSIEVGDENRIYSNLIGTNAWGTAGLGNGQYGVLVYKSARSNTVEGNVIAQNTWSGVGILSPDTDTTGNLIRRNYIGVTANGQPLGNGYDGVLVFISPDNTIEQNVIAHNGTSGSRAGVWIEGATGIGIWSNSIYSNTGAGIELLYGGNNSRAAPTISQVDCPYVSGSGAPANGRVQLFSDDADEGRRYEGEVIANGSGQWVYRGSFWGPHLTATATDTANNTSPFSAPVAVASPCSVLYLPIILR